LIFATANAPAAIESAVCWLEFLHISIIPDQLYIEEGHFDVIPPRPQVVGFLLWAYKERPVIGVWVLAGVQGDIESVFVGDHF
jgi:hypothetical protein